MTNGIKVDENTFATLSHEDQIKAIFQAIVRTNDNVSKQLEVCNPRFIKLERRKWLDKGIVVFVGAVAGFFGGLFKSH